MPWLWLEAVGPTLLPMFFVVAPVVAVFTRKRETIWNDTDTLADGRCVKITVLSSLWPCWG